jgi:hypothetical protein
MSAFRSALDVAARAAVVSVTVLGVTSCASWHVLGRGYARPPELVGEWIDVAKSSPADTSIWVLRGDGYDGNAHIRVTADTTGLRTVDRTQLRYGTWHFEGTLGDSSRQAICFSQRPGRFGATCIAFSMDSIRDGSTIVPRILLRDYPGQHHTGNRLMVARARR